MSGNQELPTATLLHADHAEGLGFCDAAWHSSVLATVADSGSTVHILDTSEGMWPRMAPGSGHKPAPAAFRLRRMPAPFF